jgi:hypothetical protein
MFPSTDNPPTVGPARARRAPAGAPPPAEGFLRRVAGTLRAFALLEDPELEARITHASAPHRRPLRIDRTRRPGTVRTPAQPCRSPLPR